MNWTEITITTLPEAVDAVCGILYETGVGGVNIEDSSLLDEANRYTDRWDVLDDDVREKYMMDNAIVKAYYSPDVNIEEVLMAISEGVERAKDIVDFGEFSVSANVVNEEDWENSWKKYYKPVKVGKRIIIKPLWEEIGDDRDVVIELDPGMAFGTGTHETTRMCLELLEQNIKKSDDVLDIGTGSGILSIGAVKLGCNKITAVDIDPVAVKVAKENAQINGVEDKINIFCGDLTKDVTGTYDIVVANIIADAIILLSGTAAQFLKDGGLYITSGIINTRLDDVKKALTENGFNILEIKTEGDWVAIVCNKG